jgi:hypothetical protein
MVKKFVLKLKNKKLLEELDKIEITHIALNQYRFDVRGNSKEKNEILSKKLKRNFILGKEIDNKTMQYGNLHISFENNKITGIKNFKGKSKGLEINEKLKKDLNYILGI